jgi:hypothetical protein
MEVKSGITLSRKFRGVCLKSILSGTVTAVGLALVLGASGCKNAATPGQTAFVQDPNAANDPASVNMAPVVTQVQPRQVRRDSQGRVLDEREQGYNGQQGEQYPEQGGYDPQVEAGQEALDEADQAPPPLPEYNQPPVERANTIWTPGYWRHSQTGYYWVPGSYVQPPYVGALWTPGYWGSDGPRYRFHPGYWGRHVGFYGGVPYGGGYTGTGYHGGYWSGNRFLYNQSVIPISVNIGQNYYSQPVQQAYPYGRVSYNGGLGGIPLLPIAAELIALHERHEHAIRYQYDLDRRASLDRSQFFEYNHGRPQNYYAPEGYLVGGGVNRVIERREYVQGPVIVEHYDERGRGNAYGHYKEHHDNGNHFGEREHGGGEGRGHGDEDHGNGHGEGHGEGHGGEGHGHGRG